MPAWLTIALAVVVMVVITACAVVVCRSYTMPTWFKWMIGILALLVDALGVVVIIAATKDMTFYDYIASWFETAEEVAPEAGDIVEQLVA